MDIGKRMKELRVQYGLTQQELADRAELTKGFISQLERNQNSPSIGTLLDIIQCLGTTPAEFFTDAEPEQIVFKADDYFEKIDEEKHHCIEWIVPNAQRSRYGSPFTQADVRKCICPTKARISATSSRAA